MEKNGPAEVRIDSYVAGGLSLSVQASRETLVGTSIPNWRGWRVTIDGESTQPIPFNRAFVSFLVPEGSHRVRLRYLPDGFVAGAALTGASLAVCTLLAARRRTRRG